MAKRKPKKSKARKPHTKARARKSSGAGKGKLPKDAVTLVVILRPREGQEYLLEAELRALVGPTRKEEGCITYDLHRSVEPPKGFLLHEVWASREAHTAHSNTSHFLRWNARKDPLLASSERAFWKQVL
jgi:quinol monooxygenase YgiN